MAVQVSQGCHNKAPKLVGLKKKEEEIYYLIVVET